MGYRFKAKRFYKNGREELITEPEGFPLKLGAYSPDSKFAKAMNLIRCRDSATYFKEKLNFSVAVDCLLNGRYRFEERNYCIDCPLNGKPKGFERPVCAFLDPEHHRWFFTKENLKKQALEIRRKWKQNNYRPF